VSTTAIAGRTTAQVARSIRRSILETETILVELAIAGIATQIEDGVWALSEWGEARYGKAFRELPSWLSGEPV
jgi:hypothetical protein